MAHRTECKDCKKVLESSEQGRIIFDMENLLQKKKNEDKLQDFLKVMNALLNEGGGVVILHAKEPFSKKNLYNLYMFDERVDEKLKKMISDKSFFHDNFDRYFHYDKHIVYSVKPRKRPLSTFSFNTKVSLNKGRDDPTHFQTKTLVRVSSQPESTSPTKIPVVVKLPFCYQTEIPVEHGVFQEGVAVQAKAIPPDVWNNEGQRQLKKLIDHCWKIVPSYITAFSKLPGGGVMYIGVREEKIEARSTWTKAEVPHAVRTWAGIKGLEIWFDQNEYRLAKIGPPPRIAEEKTGRFICEGLRLTEAERQELRDSLLDKFSKEMLWLALPTVQLQDPVDVTFHNVKDAPAGGFCVIEVKVKKLHGVSFYDKEGPAAYKLSKSAQEYSSSRLPVMKIDIGKWVRKNKGTISSRIPTVTGNSSGPSPAKKLKK